MKIAHQHIIKACLRGDRKAQKELFQLYNGKLYQSACTFLNNTEQAKGLVQETWIDIFKGLEKYDETKSQLLTWMKTILIRKAWRINSQQNRNVELHPSHSTYNHQVQIIDKLTCEEILNELDKVPAASRMVFKLFVLEGFNHNEIGEILGISASTSRVHLTKARNILRQRHSIINKVIQK